MWLDIRKFNSEKLLCPVDCELFHDVHELAAAVIPLARVAFRIFVCKSRAHCLHDRRNYEVFRRYELDMRLLTVGFVADCVEDLPVNFF